MFKPPIPDSHVLEKEFDLAQRRVRLCNMIRSPSASSSPDDMKKIAQCKLELAEIDKTYFDTPLISRYIDRENLWKLGVDAKDHKYDKYAYDTGRNTSGDAEPGYLDAMETGLAFVFRTVDVSLT